jgi:hypothetical protein
MSTSGSSSNGHSHAAADILSPQSFEQVKACVEKLLAE